MRRRTARRNTLRYCALRSTAQYGHTTLTSAWRSSCARARPRRGDACAGVAASSPLPSGEREQKEPPMISPEPIFRIHAELADILHLGHTPYGDRRIIN